MVRFLGATLAATLSVGSALAFDDIREMSCLEAHELVIQNGEITLATGPNTYERYVRTRKLCQRDEIARTGKAETLDDPECLVGYVCKPRIRNSD